MNDTEIIELITSQLAARADELANKSSTIDSLVRAQDDASGFLTLAQQERDNAIARANELQGQLDALNAGIDTAQGQA